MEAAQRQAVYRRRRLLAFGLMMLILIVGEGIFRVVDSLLLVAAVAVAGLYWSSPGRRVWPVALLILAAGVFGSSLDPMECSAWWRTRPFYEKAVGHLPYLPWSELRRKAVSGCKSFNSAAAALERDIQLVQTKTIAGASCELYRTPTGPFWIPAPGRDLLIWLTWELTIQHDYETSEVGVRPGDTVVDGGAHVGTFTRYALHKGAARVIAIEPDPINIACLEANFAAEIADGRVKVAKVGIWDQKTVLSLSHWNNNSAGHSFVRVVPGSTSIPGLPLLPLDDIVAELRLERVDFVKMDIEGAERRALAGARETLRRFKPRLVICSYHLNDDPVAIPRVVEAAQPGYRIFAKDYDDQPRRLVPKVLFFR